MDTFDFLVNGPTVVVVNSGQIRPGGTIWLAGSSFRPTFIKEGYEISLPDQRRSVSVSLNPGGRTTNHPGNILFVALPDILNQLDPARSKRLVAGSLVGNLLAKKPVIRVCTRPVSALEHAEDLDIPVQSVSPQGDNGWKIVSGAREYTVDDQGNLLGVSGAVFVPLTAVGQL